MMKKLLLLVFILSYTFNLSAQCDDTLPILEDFTDPNIINVCWDLMDQDGDTNDWYWWEYSAFYGGYKCIVSNSFYTSTGALTPDNWIISHSIDLSSFSSSDNITLSWKVRGELVGFAHEYYTIYAATNNGISDFESSPVKRGEYVDEVGGEGVFVTRSLDISSLTGNIVYIAFRHHNSTDEYNINIDDISISAGGSSGGCISDSDNDGVCDAEDQCPGLNDALIGTSCDDGDPCTINDIYDTDCGCSGTFTDTDSDGVCDANDQCPGFDDTIDTNGNGVPDGCESTECTEYTTSFTNNSLSHSGSGSSTTSLTLPADGQDVSFTISGIGKKIKGKQSSKYIERVVVSYVDESGNSQTYGTYSGASVSSATINIQGKVQSVTVNLSDEFDGNTSFNMNVNFSAVTYCSTSSPCTDSDNDGVCDVDDLCPGFDDSIDTNNNGIPDGCESSGCEESTSNFASNPLTHSGSGSNATTLTFPANSQDVSFTISGISQKLKGKASNKYIERVVVSYVNGSGGGSISYSAADVSSAEVFIPGIVQSVSVSLTDIFDDLNTTSNMSINFSAVTYCIDNTQAKSGGTSYLNKNGSVEKSNENLENSIKVYPNPASQTLYVKYIYLTETKATISLYNMTGQLVRNINLNSQYNQTQEIDLNGLSSGLYLLRMVNQNGDDIKVKRIVIK